MSSDLSGKFGDWEATIRECVSGSIHFYLVLYILLMEFSTTVLLIFSKKAKKRYIIK